MALIIFPQSELLRFEAAYEKSKEDRALRARGVFLRTFPKHNVLSMKISDYVIGLNKPTFCMQVEVGTEEWARIRGATAFKFGIYFGRTKTDPERKYRYATKYGSSETGVFRSVKEHIAELIRECEQGDVNFEKIDQNPLSQLFKAKIISLYFPDRFINICSGEQLETIGQKIGLEEGLFKSEYQYKLMEHKLSSSIASCWSNPKYMSFLYTKYIYEPQEDLAKEPPKTKEPRKIDMRQLQEAKDARGKAAEQFALEWEIDRLRGAGLEALIGKIQDRTDRPGYGYDFLSYSDRKIERYIEVKSVAKINSDNYYRFFLSKNEFDTSNSQPCTREYYFYFVFFNENGEPEDLDTFRAEELYPLATRETHSFVMTFQRVGP